MFLSITVQHSPSRRHSISQRPPCQTNSARLVIVRLRGSLDYHTRHIFWHHVHHALRLNPQQVLFEMAHVHRINSSGLALLSLAYHQLQAQRATFGILNPQGIVKEIIQLAQHIAPYPIYATYQEANITQQELTDLQDLPVEPAQRPRLCA